MHTHTINASIQLLPIVEDRHPYDWVDEAIAVIQESGIQHEVGPFATVVEGSYEAVMQVIHQINEHLASRGCTEWITSVQLQIRSNGPITSLEKTEKFHQK